MHVEALKLENGFLIPRIGIFEKLTQDKIWLKVELVAPPSAEEDYAALDQIIGLCNTGKTDASVNHDQILYGKGKQQ